MYCRARGLTLIELMIVLAIVALLFMVAVPGLGSVIRKNAGEASINELARLMSYARMAAVSHGGTVTLCRSSNGSSCGGQWEQGVLVFIDNNDNGAFDAGDQLLRQAVPKVAAGSLRLRSFPNRQYVQFVALGFTSGQSGNFTWCPSDHDARLAQQIIFTYVGRARLARDSNGDGIREGADGQPINCN